MKGFAAQSLRALFFWVLLSIGIFARANSLILMRPEAAGPNVPAALEAHPDWVLWPVPYPANSENGLLSLLTGHDWQGSISYLRFESGGDSTWLFPSHDALGSKGYFLARARFLKGTETQLITDSKGDTSESALLLSATTQGEVAGQRLGLPINPKRLVVFQANTWDDARRASRLTGGPALVVEFPPAAGARWSRFWLFDRNWRKVEWIPSSKSLGWPGLIPAKELLYCLTIPRQEEWGRGKLPPLAWLDRIAVVSPIVRAGYLTAVFLALTFGVIVIKRELSSMVFRATLLGLMAFPAMDVVAGKVCRITGIATWPIVLPTMGFLLLVIMTTGNLLFDRRFRDSNLFCVSFVGTLVLTFCSPVFSDYSGVLTGAPPFEMEGMVAIYVTGLLMASNSTRYRFSVGALAIAGIFLGGGNPVVPALAVAATLSWNPYSNLICAVVPALSIPWFTHFTWTPFGLLNSTRDLQGFDLSPYPLALLSLPLFATATIFCFLALFSFGFAHHHLIKTFRKNPLCRALGTLCLYVSGMALLIPGMVGAALCVGLGCALVLAYAAVE